MVFALGLWAAPSPVGPGHPLSKLLSATVVWKWIWGSKGAEVVGSWQAGRPPPGPQVPPFGLVLLESVLRLKWDSGLPWKAWELLPFLSPCAGSHTGPQSSSPQSLSPPPWLSQVD